MKNNKRHLFIALLTVLTVTVYALQYDPESDFKAVPQVGGKSVMITDYIGSKWTVRIPPMIQGLPVTHIGEKAFSKKTLSM